MSDGFTQQEQRKKTCSRLESCYVHVKRGLSMLFTRYGAVVGRHPLPFIVLPIIVFGGLAAGLVNIKIESDIEESFFPKNSRAKEERDVIKKTFDSGRTTYNPFSEVFAKNDMSLMFFSKNGVSVLNSTVLDEIAGIVEKVKDIEVWRYSCAGSNDRCVVDGEEVLGSPFRKALADGSVEYPYWNISGRKVDLSSAVSSIVCLDGFLVSASILRISFKIASVPAGLEKSFTKIASSLDPKYTTVTYETPSSIGDELEKSITGDIKFFGATIALCCIYAVLVTSGGDPVSTRGALALAGIVAALLGIAGAMGLLCACKVKFTEVVGIVPFLIIGIGIDDMFLVMSAWSETLGDVEMPLPSRLGATLSIAGIGITITSLTDFLAFMIGSNSVFGSVVSFNLYAGVAVLFCYIANITLFAGCLAIHGRRVYSSRHFLTCKKTVSREDLVSQGRSALAARLCGGTIPKERGGDESLCERLPSVILPKIFTKKITCIAIIAVFLGYLAAAVYGTIHLKQGLLMQDLVRRDSYYYKFLEGVHNHFPSNLPIWFVISKPVDRPVEAGQQLINLLSEAKKDPMIDSEFQRCWLTSYIRSPDYNETDPANRDNVYSYLRNASEFWSDVVTDSTNSQITATRCFLKSKKTNNNQAQALMMERLRHLADSSPLPVFVYNAFFPTFEQFLAILPATLQMVGCAVAACTVVTFLFLPHLLMTFLVFVTIVMILTGIFGFMYFWDITLSSITMIHLVMSVGFSVDFSAHVCAAYLVSDSGSRVARAEDAIRHAAAPILNGAMSTLVGILMLAASSSYIFVSFFKIMLLVIVLGMLHAVLFLPAVLALVGPENKVKDGQAGKVYSKAEHVQTISSEVINERP